jgi:hypothetical protein
MELKKKRPGYWDSALSHLCAVGDTVHAVLVFASAEEAEKFVEACAKLANEITSPEPPAASPQAASWPDQPAKRLQKSRPLKPEPLPPEE